MKCNYILFYRMKNSYTKFSHKFCIGFIESFYNFVTAVTDTAVTVTAVIK